ncbi:MscS family membrane protein [Thermotomaculum hydrothermale]|uniref:MscS family membrane protein n=1 Tax=Thermotomaculum hydrothermale TaxID=981385 RepID=A0A7R6PGJ3_9BACT|nr:mechanosensitive ion channel family protein [Thermotomaculum hydrothermale]BBB33363.1 MscS family membrane protein [Thermotomaculum hydrothermale]
MLNNEFLTQFIQNEYVRKGLIALLVLFLAFFLKRVVVGRFFSLLGKIAGKTKTKSDDFLTENIPPVINSFILVIAIYIIASLFKTDISHPLFKKIVDNVFLFLIVFVVIRLSFVLIDAFVILLSEWTAKTKSSLDDQIAVVARKSLKVVSVILGILFLIQNMGYSVSGLIASLGLGGLTVALAAKDAVSNFFGSIVILVDSPFKIGDWVKMGSVEGVVEEIGFRSTKIRTFEKSLITVPNFKIANESIENFSNRDRRRIKFTIGVEYSTPPEKVETVISGIKALIEAHSEIAHDFYLVNFTTFADSWLEIFVYCFTTTTNWKRYLEIKEEFNLSIMKLLQKEGVNFAFPSQSIYIEKTPEKN